VQVRLREQSALPPWSAQTTVNEVAGSGRPTTAYAPPVDFTTRRFLTRKSRRHGLPAAPSTRWDLDHADVLRFVALLAGGDVELDALAFVERFVAVAADVRVVDEDVVARLA
jgi:hypothetical protein